MKYFPITFLCVIFSLSLLIGCGQSKDKLTKGSVTQLPSTPFDTDNKDLLFAQIETTVDSVIKANDIDYQENTIKGYLVWDSVSNAKYSPDLFTLTTSSDWIKHNIGVKEYLNWHLRNIVYNLLHDTRAIMAMNSEEAITDSLLAAQYKWLNSHFDTTQQEPGTSSNFKYYNIHAEMLELQNKNLRELFEALTDSNYNKNVRVCQNSTPSFYNML